MAELNFKARQFPRKTIYLLVSLSVIPFVMSIYFLNPTEEFSQGWIYHINRLLEWSGFFLALLVSFLLIVGQKFEEDIMLSSFGYAILCCGVMDFIQIFPLLGNHSSHLWALGKVFSASMILCASFFCHIFSKAKKKEVITMGVFFGLSTILASFLIITRGDSFQTQFEVSLFRRPIELATFIINSLAFFSFFRYVKGKGKLLQSILLSFFPRILAIGFAFIVPGFLIERHDSIVHYLEFLSYAIPLLGVSWSMIDRLNNWQSEFNDVEIIQDALNARSMVSETDSVGNIIFVNDKFCEVSKYEREEVLGKNHSIIKSGLHSNDFYKGMWDTITIGNVWEGEICNRAKDGIIYWVSSSIYPTRNKKGVIDKYVYITTDITQKKRLQEQEIFQRKYYEVEGNLLKILNRVVERTAKTKDPMSVYLEFIDDFCHLFNWHCGHLYLVEKNTLIDSEVFKTMLTDQLALADDEVDKVILKESLAMRTLEERRCLWEVRNPENEIYFQSSINTQMKLKSCICIPVFYKEELVSILEFHSLDERDVDREFMSALKKIGEELGSVLDRKILELEIIKRQEAAKIHAKAKEEFLANMSHEIRTPMNGIVGMVELLEKTDLTIGQVDMMKTIRESSDILLGIINDVLDYSKIESGKFEIELKTFHLRDTVEEVVSLVTHKANMKGLQVGVVFQESLGEYFRGDPMRIKQVLLNFLDNAIKFTEIGQVVVKVALGGKEGDLNTIAFSVTDSGMGISEKNQKVLFHAFEQGDTSITRKFGGTGLGLAIAAKLANLMHGKIWLESRLGKGSTFFFEVNLLEIESSKRREEHKAKVIPLHKAEDDSRVMKILLVEDNKINQKIAMMLLRKLGYRCDLAENGVEALLALEKSTYDLIFMDMQMPIMDGVTCTREIRKIYGSEGPRIVAMTANIFQEDRDACFDAGMNDFIAKPISAAEISRVFNDLAA
ncbi:hypothetical protein A9Q84_03310 [Halobacteriovorax marinus]|uniref:Sensory/regulatory protein RpfC n=1 Tax=Halobacteriovorax marinus TaxID=97084 RepID=A0A1Y5FFN1_9BACT|nr:hypothetical protein A9Q84_03310 [Halobacteriovorax marinus]